MSEAWERYVARIRRQRQERERRGPGDLRAIVDSIKYPEKGSRSYARIPSFDERRFEAIAKLGSGHLLHSMPAGNEEDRMRAMWIEASTEASTALILWFLTQGIYRFDPTLLAELAATPYLAALDLDVVRRLPEWCVFIPTPGAEFEPSTGPVMPQIGFFATLIESGKVNPNVPGEILTFDALLLVCALENAGGFSYISCAYPIVPNAPLGEIVTDGERRTLLPMVNLVLYLCADEPDYATEKRPAPPTPVRTRRHGVRLFPPNTHTVWDLGLRVGPALKKMREEARQQAEDRGGTHASPRPHIRRAHWHTYHVGRQRQESRLKWVAPIRVNVRSFDELAAVVRPVTEAT